MTTDLPPEPRNTVRAVVIHHPTCRRGAEIADTAARHFEGKSELTYRVPPE